MTKPAPPAVRFGGDWTKQKLAILGKYLDAYTTAMKNQPFQLTYIDAFAGSGQIELRHSSIFGKPEQKFLRGSVRLALETEARPFDRFVLVERNRKRRTALERLKEEYPARRIDIIGRDANDFLRQQHFDRPLFRGVLFLDPFATQVEWTTIERVADLEMFDTWILFPVGAIARILPKTKRPEEINDAWKKRLNTIYGSDCWESLYRSETQPGLFGELSTTAREAGARGLTRIYRQNLQTLFGKRFLDRSAPLANSRGSVLYDLMFCAGHPRGAPIAKRIAGHLLKIGSDPS